jgi:hypothetical protein
MQQTISSKLSEPTVLAMSDASPTLWDDVFNLFIKTTLETDGLLRTKLTNLGIPEDEIVSESKTIKFSCWQTFLKLVQDELAEGPFMEKLRRRFEQYFRYDENGLPRIWKITDDIDAIYHKAKTMVIIY